MASIRYMRHYITPRATAKVACAQQSNEKTLLHTNYLHKKLT